MCRNCLETVFDSCLPVVCREEAVVGHTYSNEPFKLWLRLISRTYWGMWFSPSFYYIWCLRAHVTLVNNFVCSANSSSHHRNSSRSFLETFLPLLWIRDQDLLFYCFCDDFALFCMLTFLPLICTVGKCYAVMLPFLRTNDTSLPCIFNWKHVTLLFAVTWLSLKFVRVTLGAIRQPSEQRQLVSSFHRYSSI